MALKLLKNGFMISLATHCGTAKDNGTGKTTESVSPTATQFSQDADAVATIATAQVESALVGAGAGELNTGSEPVGLNSLNLADTIPQGVKTFTKTCVPEGNKVVVTRNGSVESSQTRSNQKFSFTRKTNGTNNSKWEWSKDGANLTCQSNGKDAQLPWANPENLVLVNAYERKHTVEVTRTVKGVTTKEVRDKSDQGKGTTKWTSAVEANGFITRSKTVELTSSHSFSHVGKEKKSFSATLSTKSSDPLSIEVVRESTAPYAVKTKTIKKGVIVSSLANAGGSINTTFNNVVFSIDGETCKISSGKFAISFYDANSLEVSKVNCSVEGSDDILCTDSSGNSVNNVEPPECDITDTL